MQWLLPPRTMVRKNTQVLIFFLSVLSAPYALAAKPSCRHTPTYEDAGWRVHDSNDFAQVEGLVLKKLKAGLDAGDIVFDISGPIVTKDTINRQEILLDAVMWDDKRTDRDTMFGDIAILYLTEKEGSVRAEIRWFEGPFRNIIINPDILTCFSENPPFADNSVL